MKGRFIKPETAGCILGALGILVLPLPWLLAAMAAAAFHELGHIMAVFCIGGTLRHFHVGANGAVLNVHVNGRKQELICAAAGPLFSLFLASFYRVIPRCAACAFIQGLYNMLPVYPLDGGRMLHCVLYQLLAERTARAACHAVECGTLILVICAGLLTSAVCDLGILPVYACSLLVLRLWSGKIPCNAFNLRVQ